MKTINPFTPEELEKIDLLNQTFVRNLEEGNQGQIHNEDSFEKAGLFAKLQEDPEFLAEYKSRAATKVGPQPAK
jgi:hypothetical protein